MAVTGSVATGRKAFAVFCAGVLLICGCESLVAQGQNTEQRQRPQDPATSNSNLPIQKIGPDDLISVQVYDSPELTRTFRISEDGMLRMPMLTKAIRAEGLYPAEVEKQITDELRTEGILVRPIVSVTVAEYRSRPINVVGAVRHPTTFQAYGSLRLLDAITQAEGLTDTAGSEILVTRTTRDGKDLVQRIPVRSLINGSDPSLNIKLQGGEEIRVPEGGRIFVVGNVKKPGAIVVHDVDELTVLRAISESEGLLPYAANDCFILRHGDTAHNEIPIPLNKIMERKAPDVPLLANDVLYIPDNKSKRVSARTLEAIASFAVGTASGFLIFHH